jgi:hypothetical protein
LWLCAGRSAGAQSVSDSHQRREESEMKIKTKVRGGGPIDTIGGGGRGCG